MHELVGKNVTWSSNRQGGGLRTKAKGKVNFVNEETMEAQVEYRTGPNLRRRFMISIERLSVIENG